MMPPELQWPPAKAAIFEGLSHEGARQGAPFSRAFSETQSLHKSTATLPEMTDN